MQQLVVIWLLDGICISLSFFLRGGERVVKTHRSTLAGIPTAYFLVSGFLREDTPEMRQKVLAFLDPVREILEPISIGLFAGKIDFSKLPWLDRTIAKAVGSPEGDWRDWEAIRNWAREKLFPDVSTAPPCFSRYSLIESCRLPRQLPGRWQKQQQ
jgi:menaquinone-dependent protoporphyrinogen IX oxidase